MKSRNYVGVLLCALLCGCAGSIPREIDGIPVMTSEEAKKASRRWFEERVKESGQQVTYRLHNERLEKGDGPSVPVFDYTYYLRSDRWILAVAFHDTSGKLLSGIAARSITPFDSNCFSREMVLHRFVEAKQRAPDSLELVWPALAPDNIPAPAWRIVANGEVWYLYCEIDQLMTVAEVREQIAKGFRLIEQSEP